MHQGGGKVLRKWESSADLDVVEIGLGAVVFAQKLHVLHGVHPKLLGDAPDGVARLHGV